MSDVLTPYGAHKIVNDELQKAGLKTIRPQMMYNYTQQRVNKGEKPFIKFSLEEGVDREDLARWTQKYIEKKIALSYVSE